MRLVTFQEPIFNTVQGEGSLLGTPSTFLRLWGCNQSCAWCDTKGSWKPGSKFEEVSVDDVGRRLKALPILPHLVVTGGNPMLQAEELEELLVWNIPQETHVTIETNAFGRESFHRLKKVADRQMTLMWSLSPKLHDWDEEGVWFFLQDTRVLRSAQVKIVLTGELDSAVAEHRVKDILIYTENLRLPRPKIILQPEYKSMKFGGTNAAVKLADHFSRQGIDVRVVPQVHKMLAVL